MQIWIDYSVVEEYWQSILNNIKRYIVIIIKRKFIVKWSTIFCESQKLKLIDANRKKLFRILNLTMFFRIIKIREKNIFIIIIQFLMTRSLSILKVIFYVFNNCSI